MNSEQVKSLVRQGLLFVAGLIAGTSFVSKFFTPDQVIAIFTSDTVINLIVSGVMAGVASFWALLSRTNKNLVATADAVPGVAGVIVKPTEEGRAIANAVPSPTVVPAGTAVAADVAKAS
jgi:hypothetical protein